MPETELREKIKELGFDSVQDYQNFHLIEPDGQINVVTTRSLEIPRFCGLPDYIPMGEGLSRWGKKILNYAFTGTLPGIELEAMKRAFQIAFDRWTAVADIRASYIKTANEAADILIQTGRIDGASSTLAWSELPGNATNRQLKQRYDSEEPWVVADRVPAYRIDLIRVACHEIGHALGIAHLSPGNLMAPTYSSVINSPQPGDQTEMIRRYGAPTPVTPPPADPGTPNPPSPENLWITVPIQIERKYLQPVS